MYTEKFVCFSVCPYVYVCVVSVIFCPMCIFSSLYIQVVMSMCASMSKSPYMYCRLSCLCIGQSVGVWLCVDVSELECLRVFLRMIGFLFVCTHLSMSLFTSVCLSDSHSDSDTHTHTHTYPQPH